MSRDTSPPTAGRSAFPSGRSAGGRPASGRAPQTIPEGRESSALNVTPERRIPSSNTRIQKKGIMSRNEAKDHRYRGRGFAALAKRYARARGVSLSSLVEQSLREVAGKPAPSFAARWRGRFRPAERDEALSEKYLQRLRARQAHRTEGSRGKVLEPVERPGAGAEVTSEYVSILQHAQDTASSTYSGVQPRKDGRGRCRNG